MYLLSTTRTSMARRLATALSLLLALKTVLCFPEYKSLAGLSARELNNVIPQLTIRTITPPPGPLTNTLTKLVNDPAHPWIKPGPNDMRGPCPGLNTLANHGVRWQLNQP